MEIKLIQEKNNALFKRREIAGIVVSDIVPSRNQTIEILSKKLSVSPDSIKLKGIHGKFGTHEFRIEANIYDSKQTKDKVELKKKKEAETEKRKAEENIAADADKKKDDKKNSEGVVNNNQRDSELAIIETPSESGAGEELNQEENK